MSGAQHQSFPTEEEALQAFRDEFSKGRVKIVNPETITSPSLSTRSVRSAPCQSQSVSGSSSVRRSNSCAEGHHGIKLEDGHDRRMAESPRNSSPRYLPSASVRTPSGLGYYPSKAETRASASPKSNRSLTPLGSPVKLSFADTNIKMTRTRHSRMNTPVRNTTPIPAVICDDCVDKCIHCNRKVGSDLPGRSLSRMFTEMHVSHRTTHGERMDPRSPMAKTGYLPASTG